MMVNNYRRVLILPVFSKLLEILMYNRLMRFVYKHTLFNKFLFGFRSQHSTNLALIYLVDKIAKGIHATKLFGGCFWTLESFRCYELQSHIF